MTVPAEAAVMISGSLNSCFTGSPYELAVGSALMGHSFVMRCSARSGDLAACAIRMLVPTSGVCLPNAIMAAEIVVAASLPLEMTSHAGQRYRAASGPCRASSLEPTPRAMLVDGGQPDLYAILTCLLQPGRTE